MTNAKWLRPIERAHNGWVKRNANIHPIKSKKVHARQLMVMVHGKLPREWKGSTIECTDEVCVVRHPSGAVMRLDLAGLVRAQTK